MNLRVPGIWMIETMITSIMTLAQWNWKRICLGTALLTVILSGAGCSGIHASKGVSPLDFILPGHFLLHGQIQNQLPEPMSSPSSPRPEPMLALMD